MSEIHFSKTENIQAMLAAGRFLPLYELVTRISPFNISVDSGRAMSDVEQDAWQYACMHLDFLAKHGPDKTTARDGKFIRFAYPLEFEAWLQSGAPGLSEEELANYLAAHPL